jgi:hypothetical protein
MGSGQVSRFVGQNVTGPKRAQKTPRPSGEKGEGELQNAKCKMQNANGPIAFCNELYQTPDLAAQGGREKWAFIWTSS